MFDQNTLDSAWGSAKATPAVQQSAAQPHKGPGGIAGFLVNALPAIGGGLGAIAGIPGDLLSAGASSVAGGAAGAGLGETIKRKILGESLDPKQIAIQAAEGGATAGLGSGLKAASTAAKGFVKGGAQTAENAVANTAAETATSKGDSFLKNLTTQGQQAQGRVSGVSAGSKIAGRELTPQDTAQMLDTLKTEGIQTGNANNTLRDVTDKLKGYGQQISDHFKANSLPLHEDDTKQLANNFISGLKTTDPGVLDQAQIIANDLQKNVNSTKDLWNFRKTLDSKIPDTKFIDAATSNKVTALKAAREYISKELGDVPGMANYHNLSEVKPFVSAEAKRLNNPSGGIIGRVLSSGPAQTAENTVGKVVEKIGQAGAATPAAEATTTAQPTNILQKVLTKKGIPVKYESDTLVGKGVPESRKVTLTNPSVSNLESEIGNLKEGGFGVNQRLGKTKGSSLPTGIGVAPDFTPLAQSPKLSSVELTGSRTGVPLSQQGNTERGIINTPDEYKTVEPIPPPTPVGTGFINKLIGTGKSAATLPVRAAVSPLAFPAKSAGAVLKQEGARGFGVPAAAAQAQQQGQQTTPQEADVSGAVLQSSAANPATSNDPFAPENVQSNVQAILQQGGKMSDVSSYLANVKAYQALTSSSTKPLNATQQQQANNAVSGLQDIQSLSQMLAKDPSLMVKSSLPGGSIAQRVTGSTDYEAAKNNIVDVISRLRSGAAISASEEKLYKSLLPSTFDSVESANSKLNRLSALLGSFAQPSSTSGSDITDLLANAGQ